MARSTGVTAGMGAGIMVLFVSLCIIMAISSSMVAADIAADVAAARHEVSKDRCTALLVAKKASTDGSVMTTHNNDCTDCDFRLTRIPAADHAKGAMRAIMGVRFLYPRYVGADRGDIFLSTNLDTSTGLSWEPTQAIGYIPQVKHTYAYLDGSYGIINEKQVAIGESTCDARLVARPIHGGGSALFDVGELAHIALERASTAREAIQIMGDLAYEYGYYGSEWEGESATDEAGEALTVTDATEAWHFHILPDDTGKRAIWAAARVPDHHVSFVTNYFVIRQLNLDDKHNYMASPNVHSVALKKGFWDGKTPFDFALAYGTKSYSNPVPVDYQHFAHRGWRITSVWAPSLNASTTMGHLDYPFSFKPDRLISAADVMTMNRDTFGGSALDLSVGLAAGPWGSPTRYDGTTQWMEGVTFERLREGHFERAISLHRTIYSYVTQSRQWLPDAIGARLWFAPHQPHTSAFVPFYVGGEVAPTFQTGHLYYLDRRSAWWAFAAVANYAERSYMWISRDIHAASSAIETQSLIAAVQIEEEALEQYKQGNGAKGNGVEVAAKHVSLWAHDNAEKITGQWWALFDKLLGKYRDGQRIDCGHSKDYFSSSLFYPESWLNAIGYWPKLATSSAATTDAVPAVTISTPVAAPTTATTTTNDVATTTTMATTTLPASSNDGIMLGFMMGTAFTLVVGGIASYIMKKASRHDGYHVIA